MTALPNRDAKKIGNRSSARRQRRLRKSMIPVGTESIEQVQSNLDCRSQVKQGSQLSPASMASWCGELKEKLEKGAESRVQVIFGIHGSVWMLSKDRSGCRIVQDALKTATRRVQEALVLELHGHVRDAVDSPHANFVIQLIVEIMPVASSVFIAQELVGVAAQVARHRYGCRVIIRLLEHSATEGSTISLVNQLLSESRDLVRHSMGRFVLQAVLEHGLPDQCHCIADALYGIEDYGMLWNAMNRNASCVFETALVYCSEEDKQAMCRELLSKESNVLQLAQNQFGRFTLRALLECPSEEAQAARRVLQCSSTELQDSKAGRKTLELVYGR